MFQRAIGKMKGWLAQEEEEPRRGPRSIHPEILVYYWDGSAPEGRRVHDISQSGAYICTPERWYPPVRSFGSFFKEDRGLKEGMARRLPPLPFVYPRE
jgi:hypothetical protein